MSVCMLWDLFKNPLDKIKNMTFNPLQRQTVYIYIILNAHNVDETVKFLMETVVHSIYHSPLILTPYSTSPNNP